MPGKRGEKRQDILAAAERVVQNRRYHEIKLDEIAAEAGVGKGTLYLYFKDKNDLYYQLVAEGFDALTAMVEESLATTSSFKEKLLTMITAMVAFIESRHSLIRLVLSEEQRRASKPMVPGKGKLGSHRRRLHDAQVRLLEQGVAEGIIRHDLDLGVIAHQFTGLMHSRHMMEKMDDLSITNEALMDLFLNGASA
jgi:AcrR family transcriptional regulator